MPPPIFTLTGNLLAERTLEFDTWSPDRTQRAKAESFQVGGKGINVSKMLTRLSVANTALCFTGGAPGAECEAWLRDRRLVHRAFATSPATRSGTVVRDRSGAHRETTFLGPDAPPDAAAVRACAEFLQAQPAGAVLAVCGSMPGWAGADFDPLRAAFTRWLERGILVVDTYGPPLAWFVARPVALVKINATELAGLAPSLARLPPNAAAQRWIVTDGAAPVQLRDRDGALTSVTPPAIREVSPTGSGDVLFACVLDALFGRSTTLAEAVAFALPYAAANAAHPGIAEFPLP
jgi:fructose-1-phosphate kinase PfkB-like protein